MTIKDFSGIDSKRTSQQSETSNEKDFMKMLANQKNRNLDNTNGDEISPTAEHLEEPSIIAAISGAATDSEASVALTAQNMRIADMLKHQSKDNDDIIKD